MNGVIVLSTRSGQCLFAQWYKDDFGLPAHAGARGQTIAAGSNNRTAGGSGRGGRVNVGVGSAREGASSPAAMQLAGLLFALDMHAGELVAVGDEDGRVEANELKRWTVGECVLHFRKDRHHNVLVVVSSVEAMGDDVPSQLAEDVLSAFVAKHGKHLASPAGPPLGKSLKFTSELLAAFQAKPGEIVDGIVKKLGLKSPWAYAALSEELLLNWGRGALEWDDALRHSSDGAPGETGDAEAFASIAGGHTGRISGGGGGGRNMLVGRSAGIPWRSEDGGSTEGAKKRGGGWFCMSKSTAVARLVSSSDVGAVQFLRRVGRPADVADTDGSTARGSSGGGAGTMSETSESEMPGTVDDILSSAALEGLVSVVHAATAVMETLPRSGGGKGGGIRSIEAAVADSDEAGGKGGAGKGGLTRVMVYLWDNFVLALPITAEDVAARGGHLGLHTAVVRGEVHEDMRRLHRFLRFVESAVPRSKLKLDARG